MIKNIKYNTILLITTILVVMKGHTQTINTSSHRGNEYVINEFLNTEEKNDNNVSQLTKEQKNTYVKYYDGFGRAVQYLFKEGSPLGNDIVQHIAYDEFGRQTNSYLPFTPDKSDGEMVYTPEAMLNAFYASSTSGDKIVNTDYPFTVRKYDNSPLNRIEEQGNIGAAWNPDVGGHTTKNAYKLNVANEVLKWEYSNSNLIKATSYYRFDELYKIETLDENGNKTILFSNKAGNPVLMKQETDDVGVFLETYYIYDNMNRLRIILPPQAFVELNGSYTNISNEFLDKWTFQNRFNERGLISRIKQPAQDWVHYVYDKYDRLRLVQDGNQRKISKWTFLKYDYLNRPILTGLLVDSRDDVQMKNEVDTYDRQRFEKVDDASVYSTFGYYSQDLFPNTQSSTVEVLTLNYYDTYAFSELSAFNFHSELGYTNYTKRTRGKLVGSKIKVLGENKYLEKAYYYNEKGRLIQQQEETYYGDIDRKTIKYHFNGDVEQVKHATQSPTHQAYTELHDVIYDHSGRLKEVKHKINNQQKVILSSYEYNEIGERVDKKLHSEDNGATFLQSIDYRYNERGWIVSMNNKDLSSDGGVTNDDRNDLFGLEIKRESDLAFGRSEEQYNGNVSETIWKSSRDNKQRGYAYNYDKNNRLKNALYTANGEHDRFSLNDVQYDLNGNITSLERTGMLSAGVYGVIDKLKYAYDGNQLNAVNDDITSTLNTLVDFKDNGALGSNQNPENRYDANGNLIYNGNKQADITYNHLDLTTIIDLGEGNRVEYIYDALGRRLMKKQINTGVIFSTTDYISNFTYMNSSLSNIATHEGRIVYNGGNTFSYEYYIKDHLDNIRMVFDKDHNGNARIIQEKHFYPFGMEIQNLGFVNGMDNKFAFNGHEIQTEHFLNWSDFGFRMYDPTISRWNAVDPMASSYSSSSPYHFANNNPIRYRDVLGLYGDDGMDGDHVDRDYYFDMYGGYGGYSYDPMTMAQAELLFEGVESFEPLDIPEITVTIQLNANEIMAIMDNAEYQIELDDEEMNTENYYEGGILDPDWGEGADPLGSAAEMARQTASAVISVTSTVAVGVVYLGNRFIHLDFNEGRSHSSDIKGLTPISLSKKENNWMPVTRPDLTHSTVTPQQGAELINGTLTIVTFPMAPVKTPNFGLTLMGNFAVKTAAKQTFMTPLLLTE